MVKPADGRFSGHNQTEPTALYVMECQGKVKIGIAANTEARVAHLQPANPFEISVAYEKAFDTRTAARNAERSLHKHFEARRIRFEWFDVGVDEAIEAAKATTGEEAPVRFKAGKRKPRVNLPAFDVSELWKLHTP